MCVYLYLYKQDLALNNLQRLICHKTQAMKEREGENDVYDRERNVCKTAKDVYERKKEEYVYMRERER